MICVTIIEYDELSNEASVLITDSDISILCYAPNLSQKDLTGALGWELQTLFASDIRREETQESFAEKTTESYYSYKMQGKAISSETVRIGTIEIKLDRPLPGDISIGEYISFNCTRIDFSYIRLISH